MKIIVCGNEQFYRELFKSFPKVDDEGKIIGSLFSVDEYNVYHLVNKDFINVCLNPVTGLTNIFLIVMQKSLYDDATSLQFSKFVKMLHPETKTVFFMNDGIEGHSYFCHIIVNESLGFIADDMDELHMILQSDFQISQDKFVLNKVKKRQLKKLIKEYKNS